MQGDPYRWGVATLPGWDPPAVDAGEPVVPSVALSSLRSPQSIAQAVHTGVALGGGPAAAPGQRARLVAPGHVDGNDVRATVRAHGSGVAYLFVYDREAGTLVRERARLSPGLHHVWLELDEGDVHGTRLLLGWDADAGGTWSSAAPVP